MPLSEQTNKNVGGGTVVQELRDKVKVGHKGTHQNDRHVGRVKELDGVVSFLSTVLLVLDRKVDAPSLEVNDENENQNSCQEIGQVWQVLTVQSFAKSLDLVVTGDQKMEESNDRSFEFGTTSSVDGCWRKGLPNNGFANVGSNEKRNTTSKTVSLSEKLIKRQDNETRAEQLSDNQNGVTGTNAAEISVHSRNNVGNSFSNGDKNTKSLLGSTEQVTIFAYVKVDLTSSSKAKRRYMRT